MMTDLLVQHVSERISTHRRIRGFIGLAFVGLVVVMTSAASADHGHVGVHVYGGYPGPCFYGRPNCVSDWYGWPGSACGWSSGVSFSSPGVGYGFGYSSGWPYAGCRSFFGPAVVRETIVISPTPVLIVNPPPVVDRRRPVRIVDLAPPGGSDMLDVLQQHAERRQSVQVARDDVSEIRPVSASSRAGQQRSRQFQAEGDRFVREGNFVKGYLKYLEAEREAQDRGDIYFRQAFALVAMGRYPHAVLKLKRGLQVDPSWPQSPTRLDEVYGPENAAQKTEFLQRVADWTDQNVRDSNRLFLMGVLLHCNADPRSQEFLTAARKWSGRDVAHLQPFVTAIERTQIAQAGATDRRKKLPPPPPPKDDLEVAGPRPNPPKESPQEPALPKLSPLVPPEPSPRELILPDPINGEYVPKP